MRAPLTIAIAAASVLVLGCGKSSEEKKPGKSPAPTPQATAPTETPAKSPATPPDAAAVQPEAAKPFDTSKLRPDIKRFYTILAEVQALPTPLARAKKICEISDDLYAAFDAVDFDTPPAGLSEEEWRHAMNAVRRIDDTPVICDEGDISEDGSGVEDIVLELDTSWEGVQHLLALLAKHQ